MWYNTAISRFIKFIFPTTLYTDELQITVWSNNFVIEVSYAGAYV